MGEARGLGAPDYILCLLYLSAVLGLGWLVRGLGGDRVTYFLAGRRVGYVPLGLSVMVTALSAVNYVAFPAEVAEHGLYVLISLPVFVLVGFPVSAVVIPMLRSWPLVNAYGYLEARFDSRVGRLASWMYVVWRLMWMATTLYASAGILGRLIGLPPWVVALVVGSVTIAYTTRGGLGAVIWTDVAQFVVLLGSILVMLVVVVRDAGGIGAVLAAGHEAGRLRPIAPADGSFFSLDPRVRITFWSGLLGTGVMFLTRYGADQMVLQRFLAARSDRDAIRGMWLNIAAAVVSLSLLALVGLAVHAHAIRVGLAEAPGMGQLAAMLGGLPRGVTGIVAAGLLAAGMSSLDSGMNACAAILSQEWGVDDRQRDASGGMWSGSRWLSLGLGVAAVGLSFAVGLLGSLFEIASRAIGGLGSPLLALMVLAAFSRRTTSFGALWGGLLGLIASVMISFTVSSLALHYYALVNGLVTLMACALLSAWDRRRGTVNTADQLGWTWHEWRRRRGNLEGH